MIDFNDIGKYKENNRIEAKKALGGLPESLWETYSAFANTLGGVILLGVEELPGKILRCIDLPDPERLLSRFRTLLEDRTKVSANILSEADLQIHEIAGNHIISIHVPRAQRTDRPVYINQNPFSGTYRRSGEGDYRCTEEEIQAMLRDAAQRTHDMQVYEELSPDVLMTDTIRRCRALGNEAADADDTAFLLRLGAAALGKDGRLHPAAAGILLFAGIETILSLFPEYRFYYTDPSGDTRQYGKNLLDIYLTVCDEITASCAAAADPEIRRGILEAFSNSLINADYHAAGGLCVRAAPDRIEFSNPGSFRVQKERVYAGGVSDPRNTVIFRVFKYMEIGRGTGSGIQNLFYVWKRHGFSAPEIREEFHPERITTVLPLTGDVKRERIRTGAAELSAGSAAVIEYLTKNVSATASGLSGALGFSLQDTRGFLAILRTKEIITESPNGSGIFRLKA